MREETVSELKLRVIQGYRITRDDAVWLALTAEIEELLLAANELRCYFCGDEMELCSIINARSGSCSENCHWCSQSAHNKAEVACYELVDEHTLFALANDNAKSGVHRFSLVTSGRGISDTNLSLLLRNYRELRRSVPISLCASMGLLTRKQLRALKEAGVERYHCNLETAESFFPNLCTTHTYADKVKTIRMAMEEGLEVCSGGIIGMGESMEQRIELAVALRELGIRSVPINVLIPIPGTPLENAEALTDDELLRSFALFRWINPTAQIRFAGGRILIRHLQAKLLSGGVNASIVGDLLTTVGTGIREDINDFTCAGFTIPKRDDEQ